MNTRCRDFEDRLDDILADALPSEDLRAAGEHLAECRRCRQLLEVATGKMDLLPAGDGQSLVREILHRTSGSGCERVREQICDFVDGLLPPDGAQILAMHIENCGECAKLARILEELRAALPRMAEIDPGPSFTGKVLAVTGQSERSKHERRGALFGWWDALIRRPRFAWEAAYVVALFLVLATGNPALMSMTSSAPLGDVRGKTRQVWTSATEELTGLSTAATSSAAEAAARLSQRVAGNPLQARDSASRLWQKGYQRAADLASLYSAHLRDWGARVLQMLQDSLKSLGLNRTFS